MTRWLLAVVIFCAFPHAAAYAQAAKQAAADDAQLKFVVYFRPSWGALTYGKARAIQSILNCPLAGVGCRSGLPDGTRLSTDGAFWRI